MGKWMDLPFDLLELVEDNVLLYADKVRMRAVCSFWHLQLPKINREFPWLLQPVDDNVEASHALFDPVDKKYYHLDLQDVLQGKICKGSSHGWVVTVEDTLYNGNNKEHSNKLYLINPITSVSIELPSRDTFPDVVQYDPRRVNEEYSIRGRKEEEGPFQFFSSQEANDLITYKFVISSDPSRSKGEDFVIAALYGPAFCLAYCTLKDKRWYDLPLKRRDHFVDMNFCKGKLHLILGGKKARHVVVLENIEPHPDTTVIARHVDVPLNAIISRYSLKYPYTISEDYLVESSDGSCIYIVERYVRCTTTNTEYVEMCRTLYFKVRKLDPVDGSIVEVKGIGEDAVILGMNRPISISSRNLRGYKGNHIYFTDSMLIHNRQNMKADACEIGVFNLEDGTLQPLRDLISGPKHIWPPPIWVDVRTQEYSRLSLSAFVVCSLYRNLS